MPEKQSDLSLVFEFDLPHVPHTAIQIARNIQNSNNATDNEKHLASVTLALAAYISGIHQAIETGRLIVRNPS